MVLGLAAAALARKFILDEHSSKEARQLATQIETESKAFGNDLAGLGKCGPAKFNSSAELPTNSYANEKRWRSEFMLGQLRAALKFVKKCRRDAPQIKRRCHIALVKDDAEKFILECRRIQHDETPSDLSDFDVTAIIGRDRR